MIDACLHVCACMYGCRYKHQLQAIQQDHHELDRRDKESRLALARLKGKLRDAESSLNRVTEEEAGLKATAAMLRKELASKQHEVDSLNEALSTLRAKDAAQRGSRQHMREDGVPLTPKSGEIADLQRQVEKEQQRRAALNDDMDEMRAAMQRAQAEQALTLSK